MPALRRISCRAAKWDELIEQLGRMARTPMTRMNGVARYRCRRLLCASTATEIDQDFRRELRRRNSGGARCARTTTGRDDTAKTIRAKSPTSLKIAFRQIREGAKLDFDDCMRMEFRMVNRDRRRP